MERSKFISVLGGSGILMASVPMFSFSAQEDEQLNKVLVQEFVGASHSDMDKVKDMLEEYPTLLNAAHDWKKGDFETGFGAACHVGHTELAQHFMDKGAQANIFTACLFGKIEIVRPMLIAFPSTLNALGPHGLTLLHHAVKGGDDALEVREYLESLGATKMQVALY